MNVKAVPGPRMDSDLPFRMTKRGSSGATPGSKTHNAGPVPFWVSDPSLFTVARIGPEMFRTIDFPVIVFVKITLRAPVVWMVVTPLRRVKVVRISLFVVISRSTGKPHGLLPSVSVKMNGTVGSGFGTLVGGSATAAGVRPSPATRSVQTAMNAARYTFNLPNFEVLIVPLSSVAFRWKMPCARRVDRCVARRVCIRRQMVPLVNHCVKTARVNRPEVSGKPYIDELIAYRSRVT